MARGSLREYHAKRDFARTAEPKGAVGKHKTSKLRYLIQKHAARALHYDFRLEWNGVLMSWAVPKGPSENPDDKRLAVRTEDHPLDYGSFEGTIPAGEYGGGTVMLWDVGTWEPQEPDVDAQLKKGKLAFILHGKRLHGKWALVKLRRRSPKDRGDNWLLIKEIDDYMRRGGTPSAESELTSATTGRTMDEISEGSAVWHSNRNSGSGRGDSVVVAGGRTAVASKSPTAKVASAKRGGLKKSAATDPLKNSRRKNPSNAKLPAFVEPQLATLVEGPPAGNDWLHEIKYDGYRAVTALAGDSVAVFTRNGLNWTDRFARLVPALRQLDCDSALLDGEIAIADPKGHTDFGALQDALSSGKGSLTYYLFDLLELDGHNLRRRPLAERKEMLRDLLHDVAPPLIYSDHVVGNGTKAFEQACAMKLEGLISKQADTPYHSGRTRSWLKSKCGFEQEFVIIGWRPSDKAGRPFSSLLLAVRDGDAFRYAGRVGSGYSGEGLDRLSNALKSLARKTPPVSDVPPAIARRARFVEPKLVAEIAFRGWTRDGLVRQGSFKGLRSDKPATEVVEETPMPTRKATRTKRKASATTSVRSSSAKPSSSKTSSARKAGTRKRSPRQAVTTKPTATRSLVRKASPHVAHASGDAEEIAGVRITHPDRVMYPDCGITKRDVIAHYLSIADLMLPHVADRPLSLVRAPRGVGGETFYQKHASEGWPDEFKAISIREKSGSDRYLYIEDERGLVAAAQMSVLELHIWCSHVDEVERPDRLVFDFDPDEGLDFENVRQAAKDMRGLLKEVGLQSFPMLTGGKGVHVVVPLRRGHSWDEHREFAEALARVMAEHDPDRFIATMSKAKRRGKIFVDYLRNQRGATAIAPFSTRVRKAAPVAVPVSWERLARLDTAHPVAVGGVKRFMGAKDPWPGYFELRQGLPKLK